MSKWHSWPRLPGTSRLAVYPAAIRGKPPRSAAQHISWHRDVDYLRHWVTTARRDAMTAEAAAAVDAQVREAAEDGLPSRSVFSPSARQRRWRGC